MADEFFPENARLPRKIQGSFTCRKSTTWDKRLFFPSEGRRAEDFFFALKNPTASAGFEPANLGTKGQHGTSRPPNPPYKTPYWALFWATTIHSTLSHIFRSTQLLGLPKNCCLFAVFLKEYCGHFSFPKACHPSHSFHILWFASECATMSVSSCSFGIPLTVPRRECHRGISCNDAGVGSDNAIARCRPTESGCFAIGNLPHPREYHE